MKDIFWSILFLSAFWGSNNIIANTSTDTGVISYGRYANKPGVISVIGVGDIMIGTSYPNTSYLPANDGRYLLKPVEDILKSADVAFGNLEGVLLDEGGTPKHCNNPDLCYLFRSPVRYVDNLVNAGFDLLSIANNHIGDFGHKGRRSTIKTLEEAGIGFAGLIEHPTTIIERDGIKIGMAAFSPFRGTVNMHNIHNAQSIVEDLKKAADIVIVSFHGGAEGADHQNVTCETEYYLGENRGNVCKFSYSVIDAGADIVFGHGPHVTRAVDLYKDRFIAYSLGNFCTYARFNLHGEHGVAPILKVYVDETGKFIEAKAFPVIQTGRGGPRPDPAGRAVKSLQRLTITDFPETLLRINDQGRIRRADKYSPLKRISETKLRTKLPEVKQNIIIEKSCK